MAPKITPLRLYQLLLLSLGAIGCYHLAMLWQFAAAWFILGHLSFLWQLRRAPTARAAFYFGWLVGLGVMVPYTWFILGIFKHLGVLLWFLMTVWLGIIVSLWQAASVRWSIRVMWWLAPLILLGVEFFRSEIWSLRFAWLTTGFALPAVEWGAGFRLVGVYGLGAVLCLLVILATTNRRRLVLAILPVLIWPLGLGTFSSEPKQGSTALVTAGVQWEDASEAEIVRSLDKARLEHPETKLFVCSEYSFPGPPTDTLLAWAKSHQCYLLTGGVETVPGNFNKYYNTAFLIGPEGTIIHRQVKAVPIQFMDDGLPAPKQEVWTSPWGAVGFAICYDMNYTQVMDELVRQGAQALIIPAMDRESWGDVEHQLSARLGATRAVEYGMPLFRLASSGISQIIDRNGSVRATGSFPGQGEIVHGVLNLPPPGTGSKPLDRWMVWPASVLTAGVLVFLVVSHWVNRVRKFLSRRKAA